MSRVPNAVRSACGHNSPWLEPGAMKSEVKTGPKSQPLPGGSMRGRPLQILGVEALKLQAAVGTNDLPQNWGRAGQAGDFHSECLFAGRATGKRVSALHTNVSIGTRADLKCYHREVANANRLGGCLSCPSPNPHPPGGARVVTPNRRSFTPRGGKLPSPCSWPAHQPPRGHNGCG
jgi:hypothetical protein